MEISQHHLLIIDVQESLLNVMKSKHILLWNIRRLIDAANKLNINITYTEQCPDKLGLTSEKISEKVRSCPILKKTFSAFDGEAKKSLYNRIKDTKAVYVCGIEAHICVLQTILDLINSGYTTYVIVDAIESRDNNEIDIAIRRLASVGAILCTTESIIFEWCKTSDRKEFKFISKLAKEKRPTQID